MAQIIYINEINENIETAKNEVETERLVKWFLWSHHLKKPFAGTSTDQPIGLSRRRSHL